MGESLERPKAPTRRRLAVYVPYKMAGCFLLVDDRGIKRALYAKFGVRRSGSLISRATPLRFIANLLG
jgi:hypothetical protein